MYFLESLTFRSWIGVVFPQMLLSKLFQGMEGSKCFVFETSRAGWWIAKATAWMVGVKLVMFDYRLAHIHLPDGELAYLKIHYQDRVEVQRAVMQRWVPGLSFEKLTGDPHREMFFRKRVSAELYRPLMIVRVAIWKALSEGATEPVVFLSLKLGMQEVTRFGMACGARVLATTARWLDANLLRRLCGAVR